VNEAFDLVEVMRAAGAGFFVTAARLAETADDFRAFARSVGVETGRKGKELFMPLRVAISGDSHGPEMARIWTLLGRKKIQARLLRAAELAGKR
jgi:glutamyl-tRNA synthetase